MIGALELVLSGGIYRTRIIGCDDAAAAADC